MPERSKCRLQIADCRIQNGVSFPLVRSVIKRGQPPQRNIADSHVLPNVHPRNIWKNRLKLATCILVACISELATALAAQPGTPLAANDDPALRPADYQPSGDYYDWRKTGQPERPWFHKYDQSLVMKIFLAERTDEGRGCRVHLTFEQALDVIERLDRITCGAPKIVYLVGWQYNGHDSKYT